ncbi:MAG: hypothetical protein J2P57_17705 [Acidimicrobiaceae bacterium]|nr:hypothetical protein [Acidimicrobiaceae bacterium]
MTVAVSPDIALAIVRSGACCVLIAPELPEVGGNGRIALFVGDPLDPSVQAAAAAMDEELFGPAT